AQLTSGKPAHIEGRLNLTNGHIFLDASHRQTRLQAGQGALRVSIAGTPVALAAECSGHTLTGPVLDVAVWSTSWCLTGTCSSPAGRRAEGRPGRQRPLKSGVRLAKKASRPSR
ncbi:MAG TPA: hypothetical protein PKI69_09510, partial [Rhodocyclaceae bacterium]|nr:hypothetical protein [Rhodocyclaceae bacterium]